jgi:hypothetical protein
MILTFNAKKIDLHLQNTEIVKIQQGNNRFIHQKLLRIIKIEWQLQPYLHPMGYHLACKTRYMKSIRRTLNTGLLQDVTRVVMTFFKRVHLSPTVNHNMTLKKRAKPPAKNTNESPILTRHHERSSDEPMLVTPITRI